MIFFSESKKLALALDSRGEPDMVVFGIPYDSTSTFMTGARFGPDSIREASYHMERFDCDTQVDLADVCIMDAGNINVGPGAPQKNFQIIEKAVSEIAAPFIALGGEHSVTYPLVSAVQPDLCIVLDAHLDLRDEYMGELLSHACTCRRIRDICDVHIYGYRECSREEHAFMLQESIAAYKPSEVDDIVYPENSKIYLSVDLDVLDPSVAPHVSNPVPGGLSFEKVVTIFKEISKRNTVVSMDICELTSRYADRTAVTAASLLYKMLALWRCL